MEQIRKGYQAQLEIVRSEVINAAITFLREDIQNPDLNDANVPPDTFMSRASQIGLALLETGFFSLAEKLYRILVRETLEYRQKTGDHRHAGALYANTAGACIAQRKIDDTVVELLKAAQEDVKTYGVEKHQSFAITGLLQIYFGLPVRNEALKAVQVVNPNVTMADVETLSNFLGEREYAFLAYTHLALVHEVANKQFPNEFSQLQIFNALRSLSSLLEVELKAKAGNVRSLWDAIASRYKNKKWWKHFEAKRQQIGATHNSAQPVDDQLKDAIAIVPVDNASGFWKSLLIAYIVRNYTTHQLETQSVLIQSYSQEVLGHILHVMITASKHN